MSEQERRSLIREAFVRQYGRAPSVWVQAPGRVDLMGSHTDYNEGYVLTMTIDRSTWIAAAPRADRQMAVASLNVEGAAQFPLDDSQRDTALPWTNYVRGVAWVLQEAGHALQGCDALVHSTVPFGSGLSSSAALEVATAMLFQALGGWSIDRVQVAQLCQKAENAFVGVNCGILDQYTSAVGEAGCALLLDCRHLTSRAAAIDPGIQVVICDTRFKRALAGSEYADRRAECQAAAAHLSRHVPGATTLRDITLDHLAAYGADLPEVVRRRARFIIQENQRVLDLAAALTAGDRPAIRDLTAASFAGARDLYEISVSAMEAMLAAMLSAPGVIGARQAGAGFGGCLVAFVERDRVDAFVPAVEDAYRAATGTDPKVYPVTAAAGASVLEGSSALS